MAAVKITAQYLKSIGSCWSMQRLQEAVRDWPEDPTWSWYLGDRLAAMSRAERFQRVATAVAHVSKQRLIVPGVARLGDVLVYATRATDEHLPVFLEAFGSWLDDTENESRSQALREFFQPTQAPAVDEPTP
jgi:hypothetical protein